MARIKLDTTSITFKSAYAQFETYCIAKNLSPTTIIDYERVKNHFIRFMGNEDFELSEFDDDKVLDYIAYCKKQGNKDVSINTKLRHIRAIFNYFADKGYCPLVKIVFLKTTKEIKDVYTPEELKLLLQKPDIHRVDFNFYRSWVMVNFFIGTGCRLSTALAIRIGDIDLQENEIIFKHVKNRVQQILPINSVLRGVLIEYLKFRKAKDDSDFLFCNQWGEELSNSGCINSIRSYNRKCGVKKTSVHLFRHTFARMFIIQGGDILRLQKILNHKSLKMVQYYAEIYGKDLHKNFDNFNPLTTLTSQKNKIKL